MTTLIKNVIPVYVVRPESKITIDSLLAFAFRNDDVFLFVLNTTN